MVIPPPAPKPGGFTEKQETKEFQLRGPLTSFEKKMDFVKIEKVLSDSEKDFLPSLRAVTKKIYTDYIDQIKTKSIVTKFKPEKLDELNPRFLREMTLAALIPW